MEIILFTLGVFTGGFLVFAYLDIKNTIKYETINGVEKNDKIYREMRKFMEKSCPEILDKLRSIYP